MEEEKTRRKSSAPIIAVIAIVVLGVVGVTIAYFTSTDTFTNQFSTKPYQMEVVETFESPNNWLPGTTTSKTVVATNKGDVDAAVRVYYTESWVDASGDPLPVSSGGQNAAIINFAANYTTNWTASTESGTTYYYYKTKLAKNQSTTSLIESVTFNPAIAISSSGSCVEDATNHTKTCTTQTEGYGGGTYTLTITVQTVQYDQYRNAWNTSVNIT